MGTGTVLATALGLDALTAWLARTRARRGRRGRAGLGRGRNDDGRPGVATSMTSGHQITITPANAHIEVTR